MKRKVVVNLALVVGSILFIGGCGSSGGDNSSSKKLNSENLKIPKRIDIETPNIFTKKEVYKKRYSKASLEDENPIFYELKNSISQLEENKQILKIDLLLLNQIIDDINRECRDIPLKETCTIEENQLYFTYNSEVIEEIIKLVGEDSREHIERLKDRKIPLGEVNFRKYDDSNRYQYDIEFEYIPDVKNIIYTKEGIKWSKDERNVLSFYSTEADGSRDNFSIDYMKRDNNQEVMVISGDSYDRYHDEYGDTIFESNYSLKLEKLNDENNRFNIEISEDNNFSNSDFSDSYSILSKGYISNSGASLLTISKDKSIEDWEYRERNIFDADGQIISTKYCDIELSCNLEDETTWLSYEDNIYEDEPPMVIDEIMELNITGGNLKEGDYIILPPNIDIENLNEDEFFNNSIGHIEVTKYSILGYLFDKSYIDKLDRVVILYENFENDELTFEIVSDKDRPTLKI